MQIMQKRWHLIVNIILALEASREFRTILDWKYSSYSMPCFVLKNLILYNQNWYLCCASVHLTYSMLTGRAHTHITKISPFAYFNTARLPAHTNTPVYINFSKSLHVLTPSARLSMPIPMPISIFPADRPLQHSPSACLYQYHNLHQLFPPAYLFHSNLVPCPSIPISPSNYTYHFHC